MNNIVDLRSQLPSLQESLENNLKNSIDVLERPNNHSIQDRISSYRQAIESQQDTIMFEDLLLFLIEGYIEEPTKVSLPKYLAQTLTGEQQKWAKIVKRLADRKSYSPYEEESKKQLPYVYEVKTRYLSALKEYYNLDAIETCRKSRNQKLKDNTKLYQLITSIEKGEEQATELFMKMLKTQQKSKGQTKKKKKKQQLGQTAYPKQENEQASTDNTPVKKDMEIEAQAINEKPNDPAETVANNQNIQPNEDQPAITDEKPNKKKKKTEKMEMESGEIGSIVFNMFSTKPQKQVPPSPPPPVKPNNQKSILNFFVKKNLEMELLKTEQVEKEEMQIETQISQFDHVLKFINQPQTDLDTLRKQFVHLQPEQTNKAHSVYMMIYDSGFFMSGYDINREIDAVRPVDIYSEINYENSYMEYDEYMELLKQENIQKQQQKSVDEEENSNEGTIVQDGYLSKSQLSSQSEAEANEPKKDFTVEDRIEWYWTYKDGSCPLQANIVILDDLIMPIRLKTEKEKISVSQKLQFIKIAHGSYEAADDLVLKLKEKMPEMSKYQVKLNLNEITQKEKKCPRLVKGYFLNEMDQVIANQKINLEQLVESRRQEREHEKTRRREDRKKDKVEKNTLHNYTMKQQ